MNRCSVKLEFCSSTPAERIQGIVRVKVNPYWIETLRAFYAEHGPLIYRGIFEEWSEASDGAFNLFHELRDRIAEKQGDTSTENKEHLKTWLKGTHGVKLPNGKLKSTKKYTVHEMWLLTEGAFMECYKCGADVRDLEPERTKE